MNNEDKIADGIIATAGGAVAFTFIMGTPVILAAIIGKLALDKLREISRDLFLNPYDRERR